MSSNLLMAACAFTIVKLDSFNDVIIMNVQVRNIQGKARTWLPYRFVIIVYCMEGFDIWD